MLWCFFIQTKVLLEKIYNTIKNAYVHYGFSIFFPKEGGKNKKAISFDRPNQPKNKHL